MPLLLDPPTAHPDALPEWHAPGRPLHGHGSDVVHLIERCHLDPAHFQVRKLELCDQACFARGRFVVTVANRTVRASRTYVSCAHADEWMQDFEQDLRAGVFSPTT
jgi:hypothetical protein